MTTDTNKVTARNEGDAPKQIADWLLFPYTYFSEKLGEDNYSVLDLACGTNLQRKILDKHWGHVRSGDNEAAGENIEQMDILNLMPGVQCTAIFCFETIEHVDYKYHRDIVKNFLNIVDKFVVFGTVNLDGPTYIDEHEIWKGDLNPFHVAEYNIKQWKELFPNAEYFQSTYKDGVWKMERELTSDGLSIYALLTK